MQRPAHSSAALLFYRSIAVYFATMKMRVFNGTRTEVSEIGLGTWQLGGTEWGDVTDEQALRTLHAAADAGVTFIDTADIYGDGRSERLIGQFLKEFGNRELFFIATKLGRRSTPGWPANFTPKAIRQHTEDSLRRLGVDYIDLTQTHCIPDDVMKKAAVWQTLSDLKDEGKIRGFGASVETMDEAKTAMNVEGLSSLQIIFNIFRQKPIDTIYEQCKRNRIAIIVRLALASGLLGGRMTKQTSFDAADHRSFNVDGQKFNVGETFAGMGFDRGLALVEELRPMVPAGMDMATFALRWCLDFDAVTTVIPGAKRPEQAKANTEASLTPRLSDDLHKKLRAWYDKSVKQHIRGPY